MCCFPCIGHQEQMPEISFSSFNQRENSHLHQKNETVINCSKGLDSLLSHSPIALLSVNNLQFISSLFTFVLHRAEKKNILSTSHQGTDILKQFYSTIIFSIIGLLEKKKAVTCILGKVVKLLPHKEILRFLSHIHEMITKSMAKLIAEAILHCKDKMLQSNKGIFTIVITCSNLNLERHV